MVFLLHLNDSLVRGSSLNLNAQLDRLIQFFIYNPIPTGEGIRPLHKIVKQQNMQKALATVKDFLYNMRDYVTLIQKI